MSETVRTGRAGGVATVTPNRPRALNALDQAPAEDLVATLGRLEHDPEVRVGVLRGAGDALVAGGDVKAVHGATELALLADYFEVAQAQRLGLVNRVVAADFAEGVAALGEKRQARFRGA